MSPLSEKESNPAASRAGRGRGSKATPAPARKTPRGPAWDQIGRSQDGPPTDRFVHACDVSLIDPAEDNPRQTVGDVSELAETIRSAGLLQPLLVTPRDGRYLLVAGHRRLAACRSIGLTSVPVLVREMGEEARLEAMLVENCQRSDITPLEEARTYRRLEALGISQRQIAAKVGRAQSHISKRLTILKLPPAALAQIQSGRLTVADASALAELADHPTEIEKVLATGGNIAYHVQQKLRELAKRAKVEEAKKAAKKAGLRVLKDHGPAHAYSFTPPPSAYRLGDGWGELPIPPESHEGLECHAVGIGPDGTLVPCCTDRTQHPDVLTRGEATSGRTTPAREPSQRERDLEALIALREPRKEALRVALAGAGERAQLTLAARLALVQADAENLVELAKVLDLAVPAGADPDDLRLMLERMVSRFQVVAVRVATWWACYLTMIELEDAWRSTWGEDCEHVLAFLEAHSDYRRSDLEREKLKHLDLDTDHPEPGPGAEVGNA